MPSDTDAALKNAKQATAGLSYIQLRVLRAHVDELLEDKKQHEIERLRQEMHDLGIDPRALARGSSPTPSRRAAGGGGKARIWYRHPDNPEQVWRGKGKRPRWLQEMIDRGDDISGLQIAAEE